MLSIDFAHGGPPSDIYNPPDFGSANILVYAWSLAVVVLAAFYSYIENKVLKKYLPIFIGIVFVIYGFDISSAFALITGLIIIAYGAYALKEDREEKLAQKGMSSKAPQAPLLKPTKQSEINSVPTATDLRPAPSTDALLIRESDKIKALPDKNLASLVGDAGAYAEQLAIASFMEISKNSEILSYFFGDETINKARWVRLVKAAILAWIGYSLQHAKFENSESLEKMLRNEIIKIPNGMYKLSEEYNSYFKESFNSNKAYVGKFISEDNHITLSTICFCQWLRNKLQYKEGKNSEKLDYVDVNTLKKISALILNPSSLYWIR